MIYILITIVAKCCRLKNRLRKLFHSLDEFISGSQFCKIFPKQEARSVHLCFLLKRPNSVRLQVWLLDFQITTQCGFVAWSSKPECKWHPHPADTYRRIWRCLRQQTKMLISPTACVHLCQPFKDPAALLVCRTDQVLVISTPLHFCIV